MWESEPKRSTINDTVCCTSNECTCWPTRVQEQSPCSLSLILSPTHSHSILGKLEKKKARVSKVLMCAFGMCGGWFILSIKKHKNKEGRVTIGTTKEIF